LFIGDSDGELARLIQRHQVGRCFEIGQGTVLAKAIHEYAEQATSDDGPRARRLLLDAYQQALALKHWEILLTGIRPDPV
jgi:hypothetical protein